MRLTEFNRLDEIKKGAKDSNGFSSCWTGYHASGTKKGKNGGSVRNCVKNEGAGAQQAAIAIAKKKSGKYTKSGERLKEGSLSDAARHVKKGALHKQEHIPADKKIGAGKLKSLKVHGTPLERKRANFALNIQGIKEDVTEMSAHLRNDPDGHTIIPHGGMGSGKEDTWRMTSVRKLEQAVEMINSGNYTGAEHVLYKNGFLQGAVQALARYEEFKQRQGKRPMARGRSVDLG
jgi:hypothetical protein